MLISWGLKWLGLSLLKNQIFLFTDQGAREFIQNLLEQKIAKEHVP